MSMVALLWKEWRENRFKVAVGLALCVLVLLLRQLRGFNTMFVLNAPVLAGAIGCLLAGVLAMEAVAGERSRGTLDFLLTRPTTPLRILLAKFAAGAGSLLVVVAAYWLTVSWVRFPDLGHGSVANWVIEDVPWPLLALAWFLPLLVVYALVFVASAATENPAEAAGAGAIAGFASLYGYLLLRNWVPWLGGWRVLELMLDLDMSWPGSVVRTATTASVEVQRAAVAAAAALAALVGALALLSRRRPFSLSRRTLVVAALAVVTLAILGPPVSPRQDPSLYPVAVAPLGADGSGVLSLPGAAPGTVAAVRADGMRVFTVALAGGGPPVAHGQVTVEGAVGVRCAAVAAGRVWLARDPAPQAGGVEILGVSVDDPDTPTVLGRTLVDDPDTLVVLSALEPLEKDLLVLVAPAPASVLVALLEPRPDGTLREVSRLSVADEVPAHASGAIVSDSVPRGSLTRSEVALAGGYAYLGLRSALVTVDLRDPAQPREAGRLRLEAAGRLGLQIHRDLLLQGGRLYVERHWPMEVAVVDLADPGHPRVVGAEGPRSPLRGARAAGGLICQPDLTWGFHVYDPAHLSARPAHVFRVLPDEAPGTSPYQAERGAPLMGRPLLLDGRMVAILGSRLAVFELPEDLRAAAAAAGDHGV